MKKILSYLMLLGSLWILSSCSGNNTIMNEDLPNKKNVELKSSQTNNELAEIKIEDSSKFWGSKRIIIKWDSVKNGINSEDVIYDINEYGVYSDDHHIQDADSKTFEPIAGHYSKDKNHIFYGQWTTSANISTFQPLGDSYGKDKYEVYYAGIKIIGADLATFLVQKNGYAKDKNTVYLKGENVKKTNKSTSEKEIVPSKEPNIFVFGSDEAIASGQVIQHTQIVGPGEELLTVGHGLPIGYAMDVSADGQIIYPIKYTDKDGVVNIVNCGYKGCFEEKFTQCSPAKIDADAGIFGTVEYNILSKSTNGCNVSFKYTKYANLEWVNKEMVCEVNNKINFQEAWAHVFENVTNGTLKCTWPLYTILRPQT